MLIGLLMTTQAPPPEMIQEKTGDENSSPLQSILGNAFVIAILTGVFWNKEIYWEKCVIPFMGTFSQAIILVFGFQLLWILIRELVKKGVKILGEKIEGEYNIRGLKLKLSPEIFSIVFIVPDFFNLSFIPTLFKGGASIILIVLSLLILSSPRLGLSSYLPVTILEEPPLIQSFTVFHFPEGTTDTQYPREILQIRSDQSIRLEVSILPEANWLCEWSTNQGTIFPGVSCSAQYTPPSFGNRDTISLQVISPCGKQNKFSPVFVKINDQ